MLWMQPQVRRLLVLLFGEDPGASPIVVDKASAEGRVLYVDGLRACTRCLLACLPADARVSPLR